MAPAHKKMMNMTDKNQTLVTDQLAQYYACCAQSYERVYQIPERQPELAQLNEKVGEILRGHKVLEIACGTGYWTGTIGTSAASVLATDINQEMLDVASVRVPADGKVEFSLANAFDLPDAIGSFTACFAGFWWSHVKREDQERFLAQLRAKLGRDVLLVLIDNSYVEGSSTSIARTDAEGNTYQIRRIPDGTRYEVLKNFPSDSTLRKKIGSSVREIRILRLEYYWLLSCRLK